MVRGRLATSCCHRRRLPPHRWWPLAVAGRVSEFDVYSRRVKTYFVYVIKPPYSVQIYECIPGIYVYYESYSSLKCSLCISAALECVEIS